MKLPCRLATLLAVLPLLAASATKPANGYEPGRVLSFRHVVIMDTITAVLHGQAVSLCGKAPLPATVQLTGAGSGFAYHTVANAKGEFRFFHVPADLYRLSATCRGYGSLLGDTLRLGTGDGAEVKIGMGCRAEKQQ